jgi:hypothetical protein
MRTIEIVDVPENGNDYIGECEGCDTLVYPRVTSCLTVTAVFADGSRTGVHLVRAGAGQDWEIRFENWIKLTNYKGKTPSKIIVAGVLDIWQENKTPYEQPEILAGIVERLGKEFSVGVCLYGMEGNITVDAEGKVGNI